MPQPEFVWENTSAIFKRLVLTKHRGWTITVVIVCLVLIFIPVVNIIIFPILAIYLIYLSFLYHLAQIMLMQQFAIANGMHYEAIGIVSSLSGRLFEVGHSKSMRNVIIGNYLNRPMRLFNFRYVVGRGKNSRSYHFTVCEIAFVKTKFPHLLLQSKTMRRYGYFDWVGNDQDATISLEEEFKNSYKLFTREDYEIEALQIFSLEVLRWLQKNGPQFSIEFAGNKMYVYDDRIVSKRHDLEEIYAVTKEMIDSIGPFLDRLHDDYAALDNSYDMK
jgi:hypothetical protein